MEAISLPLKTYDLMLQNKAVNRFHYCGIVIQGGVENSVLYLRTTLIQGISLSFSEKKVHKLPHLDVYPLYLGNTLQIGHLIKKVDKCKMKVTNHSVISTGKNSENEFEVLSLSSELVAMVGKESSIVIVKGVEMFP